MLEVKVSDLTIDEGIVEEERNALQEAYHTLTEKIKDQIGQALLSQLNNWQIPSNVMASYPFFGNKPKLVSIYLECLDVLDDGKGNISLAMNKKMLKEKKLPGNLHKLLEYGNQDIPPLPHIRPVLFKIKEQVAEMVKRLDK